MDVYGFLRWRDGRGAFQSPPNDRTRTATHLRLTIIIQLCRVTRMSSGVCRDGAFAARRSVRSSNADAEIAEGEAACGD